MFADSLLLCVSSGLEAAAPKGWFCVLPPLLPQFSPGGPVPGRLFLPAVVRADPGTALCFLCFPLPPHLQPPDSTCRAVRPCTLSPT